MIDDLEDGDQQVCATDGRNGFWYAFGDGTDHKRLSSLADGTFVPAHIENGERGTSLFAARFSGSGFPIFALMGFNFLNQSRAYDLTGRGGITFFMKSIGPVSVDFPTAATVPVEDGGACVPNATRSNCDNHFTFQISAPASGWFEYTVPFNALSTAGSATWNPRELLGVNFRVPPVAAFDVWIDDVSIHDCAGPECQPTCTDPALPVSCNAMTGPRSACRPPETVCSMTNLWCADPLMIDDMEDADQTICDSGGRFGTWTSADNGTMDYSFKPTLIPGGRGTSRYAAHLARVGSSGPQKLGFDLNNWPQDYDASKFDGITFWMKSDVPVTVGFPISETLPVSDGGTCDLTADQTNCFYRFGFTMAATGGEWAEQKVPFSALKLTQASFAPSNTPPGTAIWDPSRLAAMAFLTWAPDFDIWLDDIAFYRCDQVACPPSVAAAPSGQFLRR